MSAQVTRRSLVLGSSAVAATALLSSPFRIRRGTAAPVAAPPAAGPPRAGGPARLIANENPYGPAASARRAVTEALATAWQYPMGHDQPLKKLIAEREGLTPGHIMLGGRLRRDPADRRTGLRHGRSRGRGRQADLRLPAGLRPPAGRHRHRGSARREPAARPQGPGRRRHRHDGASIYMQSQQPHGHPDPGPRAAPVRAGDGQPDHRAGGRGLPGPVGGLARPHGDRPGPRRRPGDRHPHLLQAPRHGGPAGRLRPGPARDHPAAGKAPHDPARVRRRGRGDGELPGPGVPGLLPGPPAGGPGDHDRRPSGT